MRDYIHVEDLCDAHLRAIKALGKGIKNQYFNLGTEDGYSNFQVLNMVEKVSGIRVKYMIGPRRAGDPAKLVASAKKAKDILGWVPKFGLEDIVRTAWNWEKKI